jgi:hypothetical protein
MNLAVQIGSLAALLFVTWQVSNMPEGSCPHVILNFLYAQSVFTFCGVLGSIRYSQIQKNYALIFCLSMIPALTMALGFSIVTLARSNMHILYMAETILAASLGYQAFTHWRSEHWSLQLTSIVGAMFLVSGLFVLISLDRLTGLPYDSVRLILGMFLLLEGVTYWIYPERLKWNYAATASLTHWVGPFLAISMLCWLGYSLASRPQ